MGLSPLMNNPRTVAQIFVLEAAAADLISLPEVPDNPRTSDSTKVGMTYDNSFDEKGRLIISPAVAWKWELKERFFDEQIRQ